MKKIIWLLISLLWALLIWRLTTVPDFKVTEDTLLSLLLSNGGHFIFFGIQAVLLKLSTLRTANCILITSAYGLLIEMVQRTVPGRSADPFDLVLDTLGALVFIMIMRKYMKL